MNVSESQSTVSKGKSVHVGLVNKSVHFGLVNKSVHLRIFNTSVYPGGLSTNK